MRSRIGISHHRVMAPNNERVSVEAAISRNRAIYDLVIDSLRPVVFKKIRW